MGKRIDKIEKVFGNIMATIIAIIIIWAILSSFFDLVFRGGHGFSPYGNRGNDYMYDDYNDK